MNAKTARYRTDQFATLPSDKECEIILKRISEEADKGGNAIIVSQLSFATENRLLDLGYDVILDTRVYDYKIRW